MKCNFVDRKDFKVVGKGTKVTTKDGDNLKSIPRFWDTCYKEGIIDKLNGFTGGGFIGIAYNDYKDEKFTYIVSKENLENRDIPKELNEWSIPASTWAVFESTGPIPEAIQGTFKNIYEEWFPTSGYKQADAPLLEIYPEGNIEALDYKSEVWIPVIKII